MSRRKWDENVDEQMVSGALAAECLIRVLGGATVTLSVPNAAARTETTGFGVDAAAWTEVMLSPVLLRMKANGDAEVLVAASTMRAAIAALDPTTQSALECVGRVAVEGRTMRVKSLTSDGAAGGFYRWELEA